MSVVESLDLKSAELKTSSLLALDECFKESTLAELQNYERELRKILDDSARMKNLMVKLWIADKQRDNAVQARKNPASEKPASENPARKKSASDKP